MEDNKMDQLKNLPESSLRFKNKEMTKRKLIEAVSAIIRTEGYTGLGVNKIAKQAGVHKKLIYRYFETVERLIEAYVIEKDYWLLTSNQLYNRPVNSNVDLKELALGILEDQFNFFYQEKEMQQLILWEISGKSQLMKSISATRELLGDDFLQLTDDYFKDSDINFRALSAILSAGIYYLVLHAPVSSYCGISIQQTRDREEMVRTIRQVISMAFEKVKG
ncbi:MAG: TetR/AcrR family transcriptional regulator [Daejeonella sp.]